MAIMKFRVSQKSRLLSPKFLWIEYFRPNNLKYSTKST